MIVEQRIKMKKIISKAPGRTCLFGDHQDYLGLPVIACAINRYITITAIANNTRFLNIKKPDINEEQTIDINIPILNTKGDHLAAALKILRTHGCLPDSGYDITIIGNLPINAGTSSSSAVVVSWIRFLLKAFGSSTDLTSEQISEIAYQAEVVEQGAPGGRMDQFSIGIGGIIYLETGDNFEYEVVQTPLHGLIVGESGIPKNTEGVLANLKSDTFLALEHVKYHIKDFDLKSITKEEIPNYLRYIPEQLQPYFIAAVTNHDITKNALAEFKKEPDLTRIGALMNQHHDMLKNKLKITVPKIDAMIDGALAAGALGAKIVGSGLGGSIVVLAPPGKEQAIINGIQKAGGKDAYCVEVDSGARIII